jgi:hypothetical protein
MARGGDREKLGHALDQREKDEGEKAHGEVRLETNHKGKTEV